MAVIGNFKGTTFPSFTIGKKGPTIYEGTSAPSGVIGTSGDMYIYINGGSSNIYQNQNGSWITVGAGSITSIIAGTGLTGGTITTTGTISIGTTGVTAGTYGNGSNVVQVVINSLGQITSASNIATGTGSVTSIVAGTGLIGGTITNTGTVAIGTSGVSAGTYQGLVVNTLGQVTSATNQSYGTGSVTNIATNNGLTGGPISSSGTIGLATISNNNLLANISGSTQIPVANTLTSIIDTIGSIQGDVLYRTAGSWTILTPGTNGQVLSTGGSNANISWISPPATGVTSIVAGIGLTGGTITSTGTIAIGTSGITAGTYQGIVFNNLGQATSATNQSYGTGSVTSITTNNGITGGPITNTGTIGLATIGNNSLLANTSGSVQIPIATNLTGLIDSSIGSVQGDILYRNGSIWTVLSPGSNGQFLTSGGSGSNVNWTNGSTGTVTSITTGIGLTGGTITTTGTISIGTTGVTAGTYQGIVFNAQGQATSASNQSYGTGSVTSITTNNGLTGGPVTTTGTIGLATIANGDLLANISGSTQIPVATTHTALMDATFGSTQGDILYRNGSVWTVLTPGTSGQVLSTGGSSANISWVSTGGGGSVTNVATNSTLTGGPISTTGTLGINLNNANTWTAEQSFNSNASLGSGNYLLLNGASDTNWRLGLAINAFTVSTVGTSTSVQIVTGSGTSGPDGFAIGSTGGSSYLEIVGNTGNIYIRKAVRMANYGAGFASFDSSGNITSQVIVAGTGLTGGTIATTGTISIGTTGVTAGTYQGIVVNSLGQITSAANQSYGTGSVTSITAGTDLTGGTITTSGTINLGTSGVTAGTYGNGSNVAQIVINNKGIVTSASNIATGTGSVTSITAGTGLSGGTITSTGTLTLSTINSYSVLGNNTASSAVPAAIASLILGTPGYTTSGINFAQFTVGSNVFAQISLQNTVSGSNSSSDFIVTADSGNDSTDYADFGINSSGGGMLPFTNAKAAYLYSVDNELDIAALGTAGVLNFYTTGGTGAPVLGLSIGSTQISTFAYGPIISTFSTVGLLNNNTGGTVLSSTFTSLLDNTFGSAQGDILYRTSGSWTVLTPGTNGQILQTGGTSGNPSWITNTGAGASLGIVNSMASGNLIM